MTVREFRKRLHKKRVEAIHAEVLAEKMKPTTSEKDPSRVRQKRPVPAETLSAQSSSRLPNPLFEISYRSDCKDHVATAQERTIRFFGHYAGGETSGLEGPSR